MDETIIIAEIGECFNGDLKIAENLILVAKEAGCDIVKFQTLDYENISEDDPEKEWFKRIALDKNKIKILTGFSQKAGIQILFSPENVKTAGWLVAEGIKDVKIASSSATDLELIRFVNKHFKRVFLSTGMMAIEEIEEAVRNLNDIRELYILHCISEYPTGPLLKQRGLRALAHEDVRLNMMRILMDKFPQHKVGYSDHTAGILAAVTAVAIGAKVIEKHITLDRHTPIKNYESGGEYLGTDHVLSAEPQELREMVKQIREVEKMLSIDKWERSQGEMILREFLKGRFVKDGT